MSLMCYADDPREPDLIGETTVDLTEVLTKGETDGRKFMLNKISCWLIVSQNGLRLRTKTSIAVKFTWSSRSGLM